MCEWGYGIRLRQEIVGRQWFCTPANKHSRGVSFLGAIWHTQVDRDGAAVCGPVKNADMVWPTSVFVIDVGAVLELNDGVFRIQVMAARQSRPRSGTFYGRGDKDEE